MYNNLYNYECSGSYFMDNPPDTILWNDHNLYARKCDQYLYRNLEKQEELMILRIGICDDVQMNIACLTEHIRHYMASYNVQFEIESFTSGEKLLQAQKERPFHILLLDIEMPQINGITIAKYLRDELYDDVFIVFVTSYPEYMQESFEVQPFQFLTNHQH